MADKIHVAKVLVRNQEGKFLVVREAETQKWELPGGKIRPEENRFEAASRELEEETSIRSSNFDDVVRVEVEDEQCVNCWIVFTETKGPDVELDETELDQYRWVKEEEYREMDWHADAGFVVPAITYIEKYLETN